MQFPETPFTALCIKLSKGDGATPPSCASMSSLPHLDLAVTQDGYQATLEAFCPDSRVTAEQQSLLQELGFQLPCPVLPVPRENLPLPGPPLFLEIFSGTGRITSAIRAAGMDAIGIDKQKVPGADVPPVLLDITSPQGKSLLHVCGRLKGFWAAPACGTCSAARNIPRFAPDGTPIAVPKPLRSRRFPDGLPFLAPPDARRVDLANASYQALSEAISIGISRRLVMAIENPLNSLYWHTTPWQAHRNHFDFVTLQQCAFTGRRPKWTALAVTHESFRALSLTCPGKECSDRHEPWGADPTAPNGWSTSLESAYPRPLAAAAAQAFREACPSDTPWPDTAIDLSRTRAAVGTQPKAAKLPAPVPEFASTCIIRNLPVRQPLPCQLNERLPTAWPVPHEASCALQVIPQESQLLRDSQCADKKGGHRVREVVFGIPWTPDQFTAEAVKTGHPATLTGVLPSVLSDAIAYNAKMSALQAQDMRSAFFEQWYRKALLLKSQEAELKAQADPEVAKIVADKRVLLFESMLKIYGYPDPSVAHSLIEGVTLTGEVPATGLFAPAFRPASMSERCLRENASHHFREMLASVRSQGEELDKEVKRQTMEELSRGWLEGPYEAGDIPVGCVASRRFGLLQGGQKVRLIDDCTASFLNATVTVNESPKPHTTDVLGAVCVESMTKNGPVPLMGRSFDLKSAYRQVAVSPHSRWCAYILVWDCDLGRAVCFRLKALPFGACKSVYAFLRLSHAIWWLGCKALQLPWSCYYDDFVVVAPATCAPLLDSVVCKFLKLLGWTFATEGSKACPFASRVDALGITIDLSESQRGIVKFANTARRRQELTSVIDDILKSKFLPPSQALRLRGRLQFADGQIFGRVARLGLKHVTCHAYAAVCAEPSKDCVDVLTRFRDLLSRGTPRLLKPVSGKPFLCFTDACYVPHGHWVAGVGGVLVDTSGNLKAAFSAQLGPEVRRVLGEPSKKTIIFECELFALLLAMTVWGPVMSSSFVTFYVDNNSARDICISTCARSPTAEVLLCMILALEETHHLGAWYARVPSPSNIADKPSREPTSSLAWRGNLIKTIDVSEIICSISRSLAVKLGL